jgi:hypothetical protein
MRRMRAIQKNKDLYFPDEIPAMVKLKIQIIIKTKKETPWDINKTTVVDTVEAEDTAADSERRTRRFARTARKNAPFPSSQAEIVRFTAKNASQSAKIAGVNKLGLTFARIHKADCG